MLRPPSEKFAIQSYMAHHAFMVKDHDLMGDIPNSTVVV